MPAIDFWKGRNSTLLLSLRGGDANPLIEVVDWRIKREGEAYVDDICGEDRGRPGFEISHFSAQLTLQEQKAALLKELIKHQQVLDDRALLKESSVGLIIRPNDGTQEAFVCRSVTIDDFDFGAGGRKERNKYSFPYRFKYLEIVPAL